MNSEVPERNVYSSEQEVDGDLNEISPVELREILADMSVLPNREQIFDAFPNFKELNFFCQNVDHRIFEFFNKEYVHALADYLAERSELYNASPDNPLVILEVGAGNGRLSYFLSEKLENKASGTTRVVASDSGELGITDDFGVEELDYSLAIAKYKPDIVISSWMPMGDDWTSAMRAEPNLKEYILIGESDDNFCGRHWETWGVETSWLLKTSENPPYVEDGFMKEELTDLRKLQVCRTDGKEDDEFGVEISNSSTTRFRRKNIE